MTILSFILIFTYNRCTDLVLDIFTNDAPMFLLSKVMPCFITQGEVLPIFKKKDHLLIKNYRPVTVPLSYLEIVDYVFLSYFDRFRIRFNIIIKNQNGFQAGKSIQ